MQNNETDKMNSECDRCDERALEYCYKRENFKQKMEEVYELD